ncbi:MAG: hypothetical protein WCL28_10430 [bacterium]
MSYFRQPVTAVALALTGTSMLACKPIKVSADKSQSVEACPAGSIDASGYCVKDGTIYLLHDMITSETHAGTTTNTLSLGKHTFVKGDKLYAFGRFSFAKSGSGSLQSLGFYLGDAAIGSSTSQYVGDQDGGIMVSRNVLAHEIKENTDATLTLRSLNNQPALSSGSDGGLLLFRSARISEAIEVARRNETKNSYFVVDMVDSDKLLSSEIKPGESTPILNIALSSVKPADQALIRAGLSWEPATGKASACEGVSITWHITAGGKKILSEGPYLVNSSRSMGSAALQVLSRRDEAGMAQSYALTATMEAAGRNDCVIKVTEPSTLSVMVFRSMSELLTDIQTARFLHRIGSVAASNTRISSNASGPPIETLLQFNWDHMRSDSLMTDVLIGLGAEDRVKPSRSYLQLSRAPDSLSSHLGKVVLKSPDRLRCVTILDMATENNLNTQTRFYLTAMSFNDDSKPVIMNEAQIYFMHFRRVSDQL